MLAIKPIGSQTPAANVDKNSMALDEMQGQAAARPKMLAQRPRTSNIWPHAGMPWPRSYYPHLLCPVEFHLSPPIQLIATPSFRRKLLHLIARRPARRLPYRVDKTGAIRALGPGSSLAEGW